MIKDEITARIRANFPHPLTPEQEKVVQRWADFLTSPRTDEAFLLTGYAGTGKTSLVGALVQTLRQLGMQVVLLAPTGRAAKVFALHAQAPAYTIHRRIYRQRTFSPQMDNFEQSPNPARSTLFLVDEASMMANEGLTGGYFGSGRLLDDLVHYVYAGRGCRLLLVGDEAQLPPVGEELSPALNPDALAGYGLEVTHCTLTQVVRQASASGILWNATALRTLIQRDEVFEAPRLKVQGFKDVCVVTGGDLIESLEQSYHRCGTDQTIVVTRSNRRAVLYNNGIRARILDCEEELQGGDPVLVAKNNYYWPGKNQGQAPEGGEPAMPFIANGDVAQVRRIRNERSFYGFRFADATLRFPDYADAELDVTVLLDTLQAEAPALTREQQERLFDSICGDYPEITNRRELYQRVKNDPYYNALQLKYAYAVTCHKAQGGQWQHVYIDQGPITPEMLTPDYFRWLYTALTRATERVFLVNWPDVQLAGGQ